MIEWITIILQSYCLCICITKNRDTFNSHLFTGFHNLKSKNTQKSISKLTLHAISPRFAIKILSNVYKSHYHKALCRILPTNLQLFAAAISSTFSDPRNNCSRETPKIHFKRVSFCLLWFLKILSSKPHPLLHGL